MLPTPVEHYETGWCAKREDLAERIGPEFCSGSKVRQYVAMVKASPLGTPCAVGCSANGSMQLYVADVAKRLGRPAHIWVPQRKKPTKLTLWAEANGAKVQYLKCGWMNYVRSETRSRIKLQLGGEAVRWDRQLAREDTRLEAYKTPLDGVKRIVVVAGSGLTAKGILLGLCDQRRDDVEIVLVDVCGMVKLDKFHSEVCPLLPPRWYYPKVSLVVSKYKYGQMTPPTFLPNGEPLDGNYAAKCVEFLRPGDMLWVSGIRPLSINS